MKASAILLVIFFTAVFSQDASITFSSHEDAAASGISKSVNIRNLLSSSVTNALDNSLNHVSFVVSANSQDVEVTQSSEEVGTIVAGAFGVGFFAIKAPIGSYELTVTVSYNIYGSEDVSTSTSTLSWDSVEQAKRSENSEALDTSPHAARQPGNTDANMAPIAFQGLDSTTVWNNFYILAGTPTLTSVYLTVVPNDLGVVVGYGSSQSIGTITHNTTYSTSLSFNGNGGTYTVNCTIKYKKSATGSTWQYFWLNKQLFIEGDGSTSSVKRVANDAKSHIARSVDAIKQQAIGINKAHPEYVLATAVAGAALVAAIAVVGAMVVMKKRNTTL